MLWEINNNMGQKVSKLNKIKMWNIPFYWLSNDYISFWILLLESQKNFLSALNSVFDLGISIW